MKNKKGLGSIPKSLAWINSSEPIVPEPVKKTAQEKVKAVQEVGVQSKPIEAVDKQAQQAGRINPQLSCTITPEDKELLNELALYACNRERKVLNTSVLVRALIRLGNKYKEELSF